jgi:hypothetical protein
MNTTRLSLRADAFDRCNPVELFTATQHTRAPFFIPQFAVRTPQGLRNPLISRFFTPLHLNKEILSNNVFLLLYGLTPSLPGVPWRKNWHVTWHVNGSRKIRRMFQPINDQRSCTSKKKNQNFSQPAH